MTQEAPSTNGLDSTGHQWPDRLGSYPLVAVEKARATATDFEQQLRTFMHQRPVVAVLAAAGAGYFLARLLTRGMR
ncbi:MAG: hypothetical protein ABR587_16475 [Candidatus Binatia bacterium]